MPQPPSNAHSSLPLHSPFLISYHLLSHYTPLPLTAYVVSNSLFLFLLFSFSSHHAGRLLALGPAAYPLYSLVVSPDYFSGGNPALLHTVLSSSSSELEWIRMGGGIEAGCSGLWQTGGPLGQALTVISTKALEDSNVSIAIFSELVWFLNMKLLFVKACHQYHEVVKPHSGPTNRQ